MGSIDFFFDFASPYAYLASHRLRDIAQQFDQAIVYHPVDLVSVKQAVGNTGPPTVQIPAKLAFANSDFERWSSRYKIPMATIKSNRSKILNMGTLFAAARGRADKYVEAGFSAGWGSGGALDDAELIKRVVKTAALDWAEFTAWVGTQDAERLYQQHFDEAILRGVFGVPTMIVDGHLWWGNDRLFMLEEHLQQGLPTQQPLPKKKSKAKKGGARVSS